MKKKKFELSEFLIALISGAALAAFVFYLGTSREYLLLRRLCDSAFVPAAILLGIAGIMAARNDGSFDSMGYSIKSVFTTHYPSTKGRDEDFLEYKERKAESRKSPVNVALAGLIYLVLAVIFLIIYLV